MLDRDVFCQVYFNQFAQSCSIAIANLDENANILQGNLAFYRLFHQGNINSTPPEGGWSWSESIKEESIIELKNAVIDVCAGKKQLRPCAVELKERTNEIGESIRASVSVYLTSACFRADDPPLLIAHFIDTTEQKNLEIRFAHSQKMQAVGQLAGGVAHDFNNLLTAMIGFCDLLLMRHPAGDPSFADIMQVKQNANRAANLVRQLLAFSRRQTLQPKILDITDVLAELSHLIRRLIGENIDLNIQHGRSMGKIKVDQGQLEQVIINLAVNARDAMSHGGMLSIRTHDVHINKSNRPERSMMSPVTEDRISDGHYIQVEVEDTGCGIPKELIQQIFEPFFSTKEVGAGTGLGLSTVYGIVKQTGGYIYLASTLGEGTNFNIFFPCHEEENTTKPENTEKTIQADLTGSGTILLVEDETPVRAFSSRALANKGYTVLEADSAETALQIIRESGNSIQLIITDVIMPGMTGPDMIKQIRQDYPAIKVIFISGYAEDAFVDTYGTDRDFNFLPKPFTLKQLAGKVKEVLDA